MERGGRTGVDVLAPLPFLVLSDALLIFERGAKMPGRRGEQSRAVGKAAGSIWVKYSLSGRRQAPRSSTRQSESRQREAEFCHP